MNIQQIDKKNQKNKQSDHSLGPDLYTGWQVKTTPPRLKQIPLVFAHTTTDIISKSLTSFGSQLPYKVIYMGFRPSSNMKSFKQYSESNINKNVNQSYLYSKKPFKRFKFLHFDEPEKYFLIRPSEYRLFKGVNPTWKNQDLKFTSDFQGGNLDLAIAVSPTEYDLVMRVDSNTRGHTCWYFFKVFDIKKKKKVRFNIINFTKKHLLYEDGMKPYVFRTSKMQWSQEGIDVEYKNKTFRYFKEKNERVVQKCLSFTFQFDNTNEQVYFAYSIPYSYSYLLEFLEEIQKKHPQFIKVNYDHQSTGGLSLPLLTITNFTKQSEKQYHIAIARSHPGEPQGSWMMEGFIRYLCSPEAHSIREKVEFKIIPMVNVDGVVLGNFRTGISGRDLNRMFKKAQSFEETKLIEKLAQQFNSEVFLDFHGHSAKKNVFIYGPEYKIEERDYLISRVYPKIISKKTDAFRYYSCIFRISESKMNTGRALLFYQFKTRFVYTIQASTHAYGSRNDTVIFSSEKYTEVGSTIAESLQEFVKFCIKLPKRMENTKLAQSSSKGSLLKKQKKKAEGLQQIDQIQYMDELIECKESDIDAQLLRQILQNEKQMMKTSRKFSMQQSDSDCENEKQDYSEKELTQIQNTINLNKNDPIEKILDEKLRVVNESRKKKKKLRQKTIESSKLYTLDVIRNKQVNRSLLLKKQILNSQDLSKEKSRKKGFFQILESSEINLKNSKHQIGLEFRLRGSESDQTDKMRKLDAWKSNQLKKYVELESLTLHRNKSANQVYLQGPPMTEMEPLHKVVPKAKPQLRKKEPIFTIKKSFLPSVIMKNGSKPNNSSTIEDSELQRTGERSLIKQILQLHEKKKRRSQEKVNRKIKISFDER